MKTIVNAFLIYGSCYSQKNISSIAKKNMDCRIDEYIVTCCDLTKQFDGENRQAEAKMNSCEKETKNGANTRIKRYHLEKQLKKKNEKI